jgi:hypothetical protein
MRRRRFTRTRKEKRKKKKTRQTVSDDTRPSAGGPRALTGAPAVPSRAGPRGHRLAGSKRPGGGGGAPRLDAAGRGCSPQPRGGRARQPRGSPPSSCPGAALELVSRFELTMRRCAKKPRDRARDPGRRGARAARSEAPPETGSRTPRGSSRASAVARSVPPNPDPIRERPDPGAPERFFAVRLPRRDAQTVEKPKWKREAARTHRSACSASLALYTSSARDNPDRSSATFIRLIVRDRRETPHSTPARVRSVEQKAHPIARNVVGENVARRKRRVERKYAPILESACLADSAAPREIFCDLHRRSVSLSRSVDCIESSFDTVCAPFFARRSDTRHASTMVVGELLFTGMTDWKQVGRGKPTVRDFASPVASASRTRRDRVPTRASSD